MCKPEQLFLIQSLRGLMCLDSYGDTRGLDQTLLHTSFNYFQAANLD
jgi:hypothetical protein